MPASAKAGFVLRTTGSKVPPPAAFGSGVFQAFRLFGFGPTPTLVPAVVGTRRQLVAAGWFPFDPGSGVQSVSVPSNFGTGDGNVFSWEPVAYWSKPGTVPRTPLTVVVQFVECPPASYDGDDADLLWFRDVALGLDARYSTLAEKGIHLYAGTPFTPGDFGSRPIIINPLTSPLLGPCLVTGSSELTANLNNGDTFVVSVATTDALSVIGGRTLYVYVSNATDLFGPYISDYLQSATSTPDDPHPAPTKPSPGGMSVVYDHLDTTVVGDLTTYSRETVLVWDAKIAADLAEYLAAKPRFERIGLYGVFKPAAITPAPAEAQAAVLAQIGEFEAEAASPSGDETAAQIVARIVEFFS